MRAGWRAFSQTCKEPLFIGVNGRWDVRHSTELPVQSLYNWPAEYIQTSSGDCPFNSVECQTSHRPVMKTYKRRFLASLTECSPEELFGSASELLWLAFSQTCSEASFTRSSSSGDETFVPNLSAMAKDCRLLSVNVVLYGMIYI